MVFYIETMPNHHIILINQDQSLDPKIIESLHRKDYTLSIYSAVTEVNDSILTLDQPVILAYASQEQGQESYFTELKKSKTINKFPLLAIATDTSGLETDLNLTFPLALVLKTPLDSQKVLDSIRFIERNYKIKSETDFTTETTDTDQGLLESKFEAEDISEHIDHAKDLFLAIKDLGNNKFLGGDKLCHLFILNTKDNEFSAELPHNATLKNVCQEFLDSLKKQDRASITRVNLLSMLLIEPLSLDPGVVDLVRAASILYCQELALEGRDLLRQDYAFRGGLLLRKQLCSQIKDAALNIGGSLANPDLNSIIASIARIIGNEGKAANNELAIAASSVAIADLVNRKCSQPLFWNNRNAQRILKAIRQGRFKLIHPAISCICIRLISEALACPISKRLVASTRPLGNPKLEGSIVVSEETLVDLPELEPGMILSRALTSENGKEILNHDIVLDEDLIARIWQLSGICPLEKAVIRRTA